MNHWTDFDQKTICRYRKRIIKLDQLKLYISIIKSSKHKISSLTFSGFAIQQRRQHLQISILSVISAIPNKCAFLAGVVLSLIGGFSWPVFAIIYGKMFVAIYSGRQFFNYFSANFGENFNLTPNFRTFLFLTIQSMEFWSYITLCSTLCRLRHCGRPMHITWQWLTWVDWGETGDKIANRHI